MKKNLKFWNVLLGMLALVCVFTACSDDDGDVEKNPTQQVDKNVPQAVVSAFAKNFPNATNVTWKERQGYYVASFDLKAKGRALDKQLNQAWFMKDGIMSLSEVDVPLNVFESNADFAKIFATWKASTYFKEGFKLDEVEILSRYQSAAQIVKVEIEKGKEEFDLYFTLEGILVKAVPDTDQNDDADENLPCPMKLQQIVLEMCQDAVIVDFDMEKSGYEVSVWTKMKNLQVEKELVFDKDFNFLYAELDFNDEVLAGLIRKFLTPEQIAKIAELTGEQDPAEWDVEIIQDVKGNLTISVEDKNGKNVPLVVLDKDFQPIAQVPQTVMAAFKKDFPQATQVSWKERNGYYIAVFELTQGRATAVAPAKNEAWYMQDGMLNMSKLELPVATFENHKDYAKVLEAWKATSFFTDGFVIDDIDLMKRAGSTELVVKIEVEKDKKEFDLYFTLDGLFVKAVADTPDKEDADIEDNLPCPVELLRYLQAKYPEAVVVDFEQDNEKEGLQYELTLLTSFGKLKVEKELVFNKEFTFLYAEIEFENKVLAELVQKIFTPEQIADIVKSTGEEDPAEWDIEIIENEKGLYSISVEIENAKIEIKDFDPNNLLK